MLLEVIAAIVVYGIITREVIAAVRQGKFAGWGERADDAFDRLGEMLLALDPTYTETQGEHSESVTFEEDSAGA